MLPLMILLTIVGSGWSMLALLPFLAWETSRRWAAALTLTLLATAIVVFAIKMGVGRARPIAALEGVHPLFGAPKDFSFPSGHAAGSFATAGFTWMLGRHHARLNPVKMLAIHGGCAAVFALAAFIAYSRVYLGVHFPGDILAGSLLGGSMGAVGGSIHVAHTAGAIDKSRAELAPEDVAGAD